MAQILLVEDDAAASELIQRYTEALCGKHQLTIFSTATAALNWSNEHSVDLFILDIQLPDYRGTELGKQIRTIPRYRFTPILFTTELAGEELGAYREIKCYDFLVKPFTQEQFTNALYVLEQILYIESFGKKAVIHSISQGKELNDQISGYSLVRLLEMAGPGNLVQCHKSFLINPIYITKIDKSSKTLWLKHCKDTIPIGEKYQHNLKERTT